eukprot:9502763-Pyramimonas_sp.AAC.1
MGLPLRWHQSLTRWSTASGTGWARGLRSALTTSRRCRCRSACSRLNCRSQLRRHVRRHRPTGAPARV